MFKFDKKISRSAIDTTTPSRAALTNLTISGSDEFITAPWAREIRTLGDKTSWTSTNRTILTATVVRFLHALLTVQGKLPGKGYARSHLVDPTTPGFYHCVSRCVRRAFLCGIDRESNQSFEHRRGWLEDRIHHLAAQFAVGIQAYAVMSNHLHLVLAVDPGLPAKWDDAEVIRRWRRVFPVREQSATAASSPDGNPLPIEQRIPPERIATWRQRLGSLSWFMRALLEPIARRANREDGCTGRFWEGRFFSQALLSTATQF